MVVGIVYIEYSFTLEFNKFYHIIHYKNRFCRIECLSSPSFCSLSYVVYYLIYSFVCHDTILSQKSRRSLKLR